MRIIIETNDKVSETATAKVQEPVVIETYSGGAQAVEPLSPIGEVVSISAEHRTGKVGVDAGPPPAWLLDALQHQTTVPEVPVTGAVSIMDGGAAPSE
jgi:hypothetical protein